MNERDIVYNMIKCNNITLNNLIGIYECVDSWSNMSPAGETMNMNVNTTIINIINININSYINDTSNNNNNIITLIIIIFIISYLYHHHYYYYRRYYYCTWSMVSLAAEEIPPVSITRFPSFRTQTLENLSHYL